jgi:hypothetical protein
VVAALTALGAVSERLLAFLAVYVGYPRASVAMEVAREELAGLRSE